MGKKTPAPSSAGGSPKKKAKGSGEEMTVPSVAEMGQLTAAAGSIPRPNFGAGITMEVFSYCTCASVYSEAFGDDDLTLMNMACDDQPNPLFYFSKIVEIYGATTKDSPTPAPMTRDEIASEYNAKFEFVSKKTVDQDVDKVRWRKNGLGVFIWGGAPAVNNFIMYVDDVIDWRTTFSDAVFEPLGTKPKITIHVPATYQLELSAVDDELKCMMEVKKETSGKFTVFDVPPPTFPSRIVILTFDLVSTTTAHAIFSGNTKPFQKGFADLKIRGKSLKLHPTAEFAEFFRVREPAFDLKQLAACTAELNNILGDGCLKSSLVIVRVKNPNSYETNVLLALTETLNECTNIRFEL